MRPGADLEPEDAVQWVKPVRTAVFPVLALPDVVGDIGGLCFVVSAGLVILSSALQAATFRVARAGAQTQGSLPLSFGGPPMSLWDRLDIFGRGAGSLTVAVVLLFGMVLLALAAHRPGRRQRTVLVAAGSLALVIVVVDAILCIRVLNNSIGPYGGVLGANRAAAALQFLAPAALAGGVAVTGWFRLRTVVEPADLGEDVTPG